MIGAVSATTAELKSNSTGEWKATRIQDRHRSRRQCDNGEKLQKSKTKTKPKIHQQGIDGTMQVPNEMSWHV